MRTTGCHTIHPRHAELVAMLEEYLADSGWSARWLGLRVAQDARLLSNLKRGQHYKPAVMVSLCQHVLTYYEGQRSDELPLAA